ncbi:alpha/beta hydrolase [Lysinibacillus contaminans]|uniref:Alpha/beta hydrolase n=1 Tax=Lysinibacillus contaminans TaxID=1293441 RepID=A0ABR5JVR8_9BACI|nr:alpha/beta hydrolase [Lysinibacillus contaminans]KOS66247.1 alpha/beta hydrolase [Lysinibacillus contaminans]
MTFKFDSEIQAVFDEIPKNSEEVTLPKRGDWKALREMVNALIEHRATQAPSFSDVKIKSFNLTTKDNAEIELRWYTKIGSNPGSAVVYAHGGGMVCGNLDMYDPIVSHYVSLSGVPFLAVEYRLAPENPGTGLVEDTYAAITWLIEHASELGIESNRIAVMGDSAGGGIAAGVAILARDRETPLLKQILIYPMLDDRNLEPDMYIVLFASWTYDNNYTGWKALLGEDLAGDNVSPIAAPARNTNFEGLAPAYIEVGELDIFRDEDVDYAKKLWQSGISVELHVHPGAQHAFEQVARSAQVTQRSMADRVRVLQSL